MLLEGNDIGQVILPSELDSNLNDMENVIQQQQNVIDSQVLQGLINTGDSQVSRQNAQSNEMLGKSMDFLDKMCTSL